MGFLFSGVFWGIVLVLLGLSVLIKVVFNLDIPVFRILFGLILIYVGVRVMAGSAFSSWKSPHPVIFSESTATAGEENRYSVIFGKGEFDLQGKKPTKDRSQSVEVRTTFGSSRIFIAASVPTMVRAQALFGAVKMPGREAVAMGTVVYTNKAYREGKPALKVDLPVTFGEAMVLEK